MAALLSGTALAAVAAGAVASAGQAERTGSSIAPGSSFEVASVRLTAARTPPTRLVTDTRVALTNISLEALLVRVFQLDLPSRLSAPGWLSEVHVDIHATLPTRSTRADAPEMLKTLLITRFGLRAHMEARPTDVYELAIGKDGVRFQEVPAVDEIDKQLQAAPSPPVLDWTVEGIEGRVRSIITDRGLITITERSMYERIRTGRGTEEIDAARISMAQLANLLSFTVDRPVIDGTGLPGLYRLRIELPPPTFPIASPLGTTPRTAPDVISPFAAVERLGLRLEPTRAPVDTLMVDHIDRVPTEN